MSYKPLSQTVTDGQKNPISSDAVNDHVAAEIAAIPASASLTLNNLTAPTAVNQDLLLDAGKKIRLNSSQDVNSLVHAQSDAFINTGVTVTRPNTFSFPNTFTANSSITGILAVNDYVRLNGLENIARVTAINSSTSFTVSNTNLFADRTTELTREIQKIKPMVVLRNNANAETITFTGSQAVFPSGQSAGNNAFVQAVSLPGITFAGNEGVGFAAPVANQISILGPIVSDGGGTHDTERFRFTCTSSPSLSFFGTASIDFLRASSFSIKMSGGTTSPVTYLSTTSVNNPEAILIHKNLTGSTADASQVLFANETAYCFGIATSNGLGSVASRRFFGGAFRQKLQVGNFSNPGWFLDGGVLSVHGLDQDVSGNSTIRTNGTNVISHLSGFAGSTAVATALRAVGMGVGDTIQITKANQPTIWRKIIREGSTIPNDNNAYGSGLQYVLNDVVSADYDGGNIAVLPALVRVATQNDAEVIEVDYAGNSKFKPVQAVELSSGNLSIASLGRSLQMATGSNAAAGLATIANGDPDVTVSTLACGPNSIILVTNNTSDAHVSVSSKALGSFKIDHGSNVSGDQSCAWFIINPEDVDYVSFITTASISDSTQKSAIAALISALKSQGLWDAMTAIYPFVGGTNTAHSYNLKNPAEYQITWSGTVTHDANGITGNGTDGYGDTNIAGNLLFQNNQHLAVYSRTNSSITATDIGAEIAAGGNKGSHFAIRTAVASNPTRWANSAAQSSVNNIVTNTQGLFVSSRQVSNAQVFYRNTGILANSGAVNSEALTFPETFTIGARKSGASVVDYSTRNYAFASIGRGLTTPQVVRLYAIVQAFQTTLGRNV